MLLICHEILFAIAADVHLFNYFGTRASEKSHNIQSKWYT